MPPKKPKYAISPTRIETYLLCPRKWAMGALLGYKQKYREALDVGTKYHAVVEDYFRHGKAPPKNNLGKMFMQALPYYPQPSKALLIEHGVVLPVTMDFSMPGTADLIDTSGNTPTLYDHKTCGSFRYVPSPDDLLSWMQPNCYGLATMLDLGVETLNLRWVYVTKDDKPQAQPVDAVLTKKSALTIFENLTKPTAGAMLDHYKEPPKNLTDVKANYGEACNKFGGCDFKDECWKYKTQETKKQEIATMGKIDDLLGKKTVKKEEPKSEEPKAETKPKGKSIADLLGKSAKAPDIKPAKGSIGTGAKQAINPPEQANAPDDAAVLAAMDEKKSKGQIKSTKQMDMALKPKKQAAAPVDLSASRMTIYVGCVPTKGPVFGYEYLVDFLKRTGVLEQVNSECPSGMWQLEPYAGGAPILQKHLDDYFELHGSEGLNLLVDQGSDISRACLPVLIAHADTVIQKMNF